MKFEDFYSKLLIDLKLGLAPVYVFYNDSNIFPNTFIEVNQKVKDILLNMNGNKTSDIDKLRSVYNKLIEGGYLVASELNYRRSFG